MTIYGIDVSHYQATTPSLVGRSFLIAKATEGGTVDPMFDKHIAVAKGMHRVTGAYCFNRADLPIDYQLNAFIQAAVPKVDLYALDCEEEVIAGTQRFSVAQAKAFMDGFRKRTGLPIGLYMSESPYRSGGYKAAGHDWLWIAHYNTPKPGIPYDIWQYSSSGGLDKDRFEGTLQELLALGVPTAPPSDIEVPVAIIVGSDRVIGDVAVGTPYFDAPNGTQIATTGPGTVEWLASPTLADGVTRDPDWCLIVGLTADLKRVPGVARYIKRAALANPRGWPSGDKTHTVTLNVDGATKATVTV